MVSDTYYRAIAAPNADLITDAIERIEPHGIRTADGRLREADLLILATGLSTPALLPLEIRASQG
ncbi:hypothetical protein ACWDSJ_21005 [Nocardia sp. NPDC003482]